MGYDQDFVARQAEYVRDLIRRSELFEEPIDLDNHDEALVAAYVLGATGAAETRVMPHLPGKVSDG